MNDKLKENHYHIPNMICKTYSVQISEGQWNFLGMNEKKTINNKKTKKTKIYL